MNRDDIKELFSPFPVTELFGSDRRTMGATSAEQAERASDVRPREVEVDENAVYSEVAQILRKGIGLRPDDYLQAATYEDEQRIASLYLALRIAISDAIENQTPANKIAVAEIVERLAVESLRDKAVERVCARRSS